MDARYSQFVSEASRSIERSRLYTDELRTLAWGTDAGFYRLQPKVVVRAKDENEVIDVLHIAARLKLPITFRAAGTSLSGQSVSDSILLVAGKNWERYRLLDDKATAIALQPGITGSRVNDILAPYGRTYSPDPASKNSAMVGGIVANNASGMKCGIHANSDRILKSIRIVLADGCILDTGDSTSKAHFKESHAGLIAEIERIRDEIRSNKELSSLIEYKYSIKNVTGLNLLPFLRYDDPFDIIAHCMVGSEGTLAFISEVSVYTEAIAPFTASAMVYFDDMAEASRAVVAMRKDAPIQACEMLDKKSLSSVNDTTGKGLTALLIQTEADSAEQLDANKAATLSVLDKFKTFLKPHFSSDKEEVARWWQLRSGIFPTVGGMRPTGTTVLIEDIAFHIDDLPTATTDLSNLLENCGYDDACIYGHALEGNYHFVISQSFDTPAQIEKYRNLMLAIEDLVVNKYHGSLKAEHGTGRNMAPFVEKEWGSEAWSIMKRLKNAFDPDNILNPGVIFNDDPECYIHNIKPLPRCNEHIDKCIECGFCEVNCVSCGLTLSARQRIAIQREIARLRAEGDNPARLSALERGFAYYGNETCAGDGLCSTSCPMHINTADLIHDIRELHTGVTTHKVGKWAAKHLSGLSTALRLTLYTADIAHRVVGDKAVNAIGHTLHKAGLPLWTPSLPKPYNPRRLVNDNAANRPVTNDDKGRATTASQRLVYYPSCLNRMMGPSKEATGYTKPLAEVFVELCNRAGYEVIFPDNMDKLCCGMIWESKGMADIADAKTAELEEALLKASDGGKTPVVCDQSPCLHRMREHIKSMTLYEPAEFILDYLVPNLHIHRLNRTVAVHVTCSSRRMGITGKMVQLANLCATKVVVPAEVGCCGFAGDKGFTVPELNAWGLRKLKAAVQAGGATEGYSNSRTCEIGLTTHSGIPYKSIAYLVLEASSPE